MRCCQVMCLASRGLAELAENVQNHDSHLPPGDANEENKARVYELDTAAVAVDRQEELAPRAAQDPAPRSRRTPSRSAAGRHRATIRRCASVQRRALRQHRAHGNGNGYFGVSFE